MPCAQSVLGAGPRQGRHLVRGVIWPERHRDYLSDTPLAFLPVLRSRGRHIARMGASFNVLWTGQSISLLGDYIAYYTVPAYVLTLNGTASDFTTIFALENAPTLLFGFFLEGCSSTASIADA